MKKALSRFFILLSSAVLLSTNPVFAMTANDRDCARQGGTGGTCSYNPNHTCALGDNNSTPSAPAGADASTLTMEEVDLSGFHPDPQAEEYFNKTSLPKIKKFLPQYVKAAQLEGVPQNWEILPALHGPELGFGNYFRSNGVSNSPAGAAGGPSGPYQETAYEMKDYRDDPGFEALKTLVTAEGTAKNVADLNKDQFLVLSRLVFKRWVAQALGNDYQKLRDGPIKFDPDTSANNFLVKVMARWNSGNKVEGFNGFDSGANAYNPGGSVWPGMATTYYLLKKWEAGGGMSTVSLADGSGGTGCQSTSGGGVGGASPDCASAAGNEKILCEAKHYDGIYYRYGGGHTSFDAFMKACPDPSKPGKNEPTGAPELAGGRSGNPSPCATDCSSIVSIAVDRAFNQKFMWVVGSMQGDTANWKKINIEEVKAGDTVTRGSEHVEIVDHYDSSTHKLHTFGSHSTGTKTSAATSTLNAWDGAYRYIGPGASQ